MADLFLSHSSSDVGAVRDLRRHLEAGGYRCWMAPDDVSSAEPWAEQIVDAIRACRVVVVLLSERSIGSDHVSREVGLAVQAGKPVLPVRIERVLLTGTLAYLLQLVQWVDAFPGPIDTHLDDIGGRIADLLRRLGAEPAPHRGAAPQPRSGPTATGRAAATPLPKAAQLGVIGAGSIIAVASALPWATVSAGTMSLSLSGIDREGVGLLTMALGIALVAIGSLAWRSPSRRYAALATGVAIVVALMGIAEAFVQRRIDVVDEHASLSIGIGLWVLMAGAVLGVLSGLALAFARRTAT